MFNASDAVWQPGIFKRWQFDQWHRQSEHSQQAIVRYVGSEDRNTRDTRDTLEGSFWLTVYAHQISGAREVEGIQERVRRFEKLGELERLEHFADYAVEVMDGPAFPIRQGLGLGIVSELLGSHSLSDYYDWHNRLMSWHELIAFSNSVMPAVTTLHNEVRLYHGHISADNIFFKAGSNNLHNIALAEHPLKLCAPYPFEQTLEYFPQTVASFLVRSPEQMNARVCGSLSPYTDIWQIAMLLYRKLTGQYPLDISRTPRLGEIFNAVCEKKLSLNGLPEPLRSVFARAFGGRFDRVEEFGNATIVAAQECQEAETKVQRRNSPADRPLTRRMFGALAVATVVALVGGTAVVVGAAENGAPPPLPVSPPDAPGKPFSQPGKPLSAVVPLSGKEFITGTVTGLLSTYAPGKQKPLRTSQLSYASLHGMVLSADGQSLVCYDENGNVSQVDAQMDTKAGKQTRLSRDARALALLGSDLLVSDGKLVRFFAGALAKSWSTPMSADLQYAEHTATVTALAALSDNLVASSSMDRTVKVWSVLSGETSCSYGEHESEVLTVAATTAGALQLASGDRSGVVNIWMPQGEGRRIDGYSHAGAVTALAWSPGGRYLISGSDDALVKVYDTWTMRVIKEYTHHDRPIVAVAWLSDTFVVTMSASEIDPWQAV